MELATRHRSARRASRLTRGRYSTLTGLQATIPHLTRSSLHRCLQRHGISRLPEVEGEKTAKRKFKSYPIRYFHTVLTDNGTHFTDPTGDGWTPEDIKAMRAQNQPVWCHAFEAACADLDIEHRLTKPRHPWTNGQVERMNRTIKDATVKRYHYDNHDQLRQHLDDFVAAYNFARRLKALRGLTPYEAICKAWTDNPTTFKSHPHHQLPGSNI